MGYLWGRRGLAMWAIATAACSASGAGGAPWTPGSGSGSGSSQSPGASSGGGGQAASGSGGSGSGSGGSGSGGSASSSGSSSGAPASDAGRATAGDAAAATADSGAAAPSEAGSGSSAEGGAGANPCTTPGGPSALTVAADGSGQFTSVQQAVNSVASGTTPVRIDIRPGTYTENLTIANRTNILLCGQDPMTTILTFSASGSSEATATRISANNFSAANITFENSSPLGSGQAVALLASGTAEQFLNCRFVSYQDTLYVKSGSQYFKNCYVQGNTDYVFGAASAVLDNCSIYSISGGTAVTAPNTAAGTTYGIVFLGGTLTAASTVRAGSVALGRPWGPAGSTTYLHTNLGSHISAVGWVAFNANPVTGARFAEYQSTGPGADPAGRAAGSAQLTDTQAASYTISNVLGGWTPSFSQ